MSLAIIVGRRIDFDQRFNKMKTIKRTFILGAATIALTFSLPALSAGRLIAQDADLPQEDVRANDQPQARTDGDLIGRLNLTPDQIRQVREIRQQSAEEMRNTRQRMGRAQRALDEAIYADSVDEAVIEARAKDLASAQAAMARHRALTELRIRRVLTPEQLKVLRGIRQEAMDRGRQQNQRGRRQNPTAFQERQRSNDIGPNPTGVRQPNQTETKTGTTEKTPNDTTPANGKP